MIYAIAAASLVFLGYLVLDHVRDIQLQRLAVANAKRRRTLARY